MKRKNVTVFLIVITVFVLTTGVMFAAGTSEAEGTDKPIVMKLASVAAPQGLQYDGYLWYENRIEELTDGKVDIQVFAGGQLGEKISTMEALQSGTIELCEVAATDLSTFNRRWQVFSLPYMYNDGAHMLRAFQDPKVRSMLDGDLESEGFKLVSYEDVGARSVVNSVRDVKTPADLNGVKIRVMQDPVLAESLKLMGANAIPFNWTEIYTALQQGTLDGLEHAPFAIVDMKFYEVAKHMSLTEHFRIPGIVLMSLKVWNDLPADIQDAFLQVENEYPVALQDMYKQYEDKAIATLEENGVTVSIIDQQPFRDAVVPIYDKFLSTAAPGARELFEAIKNVK